MLDSGLEEDIAVIIPHQANLRILKKLPSSLISTLKFYINIEKYGNTSAASIPIAFDEYMSAAPGRRIKKLFCRVRRRANMGAAMLTL